MIPVVIYAARSQAEEPGKDSTGDQVAIIRKRLESEPNRFVYSEPHVDHASGYHADRGPGLEAAMHEAERAATEHGRAELWVFKSERLARGSGRKDEARSVMEVYVDARRVGVDLRSVEDDEYFTNPMLVGIADAMAHKYSKDLAAHVKRGIDSRVTAKGDEPGKPWGEPGYGYALADDGHWRTHPDEATVARRAAAEYVARVPSFSGVSRWLNAQGIQSRRGTRWTPTVIKRLLTSRHVLGEFQHGGEWHKGKHEPIIDLATWEAVQTLAEQGRKSAPRGRAGRLPKRHVFVRGMLRCGICGEAMLPRSEDANREVYVCRTHKGDAAACPMPVLRRAAVDLTALRLFERVALDIDATREQIAAQLDTRIAEARERAERAAHEVAEKTLQLARIERDYLAEELGAQSYERLRARLEDERSAADNEREQATAHAKATSAKLADLDAENETLRRLAELRTAVAGRITDASGDIGALRAAMAVLFSRVVVTPTPALLGVPGAEPWERVGAGEPLRRLGDRHDLPANAQLYVWPQLRSELVPEGAVLASHMAPRSGVPILLESAPENKSTSSGVPE